MEITKGVSIPQLTIKDYVETLETCSLCGGKLRYNHQTDYLTMCVTEECGCPTCGIKNTPVQHTLQ